MVISTAKFHTFMSMLASGVKLHTMYNCKPWLSKELQNEHFFFLKQFIDWHGHSQWNTVHKLFICDAHSIYNTWWVIQGQATLASL